MRNTTSSVSPTELCRIIMNCVEFRNKSLCMTSLGHNLIELLFSRQIGSQQWRGGRGCFALPMFEKSAFYKLVVTPGQQNWRTRLLSPKFQSRIFTTLVGIFAGYSSSEKLARCGFVEAPESTPHRDNNKIFLECTLSFASTEPKTCRNLSSVALSFLLLQFIISFSLFVFARNTFHFPHCVCIL